MDRFSRADLRELMDEQTGTRITLTMPTHRSGPETQQNPIRLKNLKRQAEDQLVATGLRATEAHDRLSAVEALLADSGFWRQQSDGLAVFVGVDGAVRSYRVPLALDEAVVVGPRFHVKPLLPLVTNDGRFFILALSQNQVRLLQCTRHHVGETSVEGLPQSLAEALKYDEGERQIQYHQAGAGTGSGAVFHGQGGIEDAEDERRLRFCQAIDHALHTRLHEENAPLVLAAVESMMATYRTANSYPHLVAEGIPGSPDRVPDAALHEAASAIVAPELQRGLESAMAKVGDLLGSGGASTLLPDIVRAAHEGRVDTLFVAEDIEVWGAYDAATGEVALLDVPQPGGVALTDLAAARTAVASGNVYVVPAETIPGGAPAAALLRY